MFLLAATGRQPRLPTVFARFCNMATRASALFLLRLAVLLLISAVAHALSFVPVQESNVAGRYIPAEQGPFAFDWPGVSFFVTGFDFPSSSVWVGPGLGASIIPADPSWPSDSSYVIAAALDPLQNYTIRLSHDLSSGQTRTRATGVPFSLFGFALDDGGVVLPNQASAVTLPHRLEILGDSITVGAGAEGAPPGPCPYSSYLEHNSGTWDRLTCANLTANCSVVAWSGKGMYANANGEGETMASYYLQTTGASNYTSDWDFGRFAPDALVINLGTNDFGSPCRHCPGFATNFSTYYTSFVLNATRLHYGRPTTPVFVAQGPMNNSPELTAALQAVITAVNGAGGRAYFLDLRNLTQDGCGSHPGPRGHAQMAGAASAQIAAVMGWTTVLPPA